LGRAGAGGILVLDAGTSTLDFTLFAARFDKAPVRVVDGRLDRLYAEARFHAEDATALTVTDVDCADESPPGHRTALEFLFNWLEQRAGAVPVLAVGHRVAYGGPRFSGPARIDAPTLRYLQALAPLAPARQRASLRAMRAIAQRWPELPQVACFESAFHHDVLAPEHAFPLPNSIGKRRRGRYGYDGLAFEAVIDALPGVDERAARGKTIVVHVSVGVSLCALDGKRRVAVATGSGDLDGESGERSRRLDPRVARHLGAALRMGPGQVRAPLRQRSERLGVSGLADALDRLVGSNEPRAGVAIELVLDAISREVESLAAALCGLDTIVFTAGAGPHAAPTRAGICCRVSWLDVDLDAAANEAGGPRLTRPGSRVTAWVIPADKPLCIARQTLAAVG
jgi:acetate kinase